MLGWVQLQSHKSFPQLNPVPRYFIFKGLIDRVTALTALAILSPMLLLVAILVRWRLGAPVLFRQLRPGFRERPFQLLKFRTMSIQHNTSGDPLPNSQKLTPFGRWLRSTSIDELPGLINILRGEMSFIGPRPLLMQYLPLYSAEQARRHDVKPGFSGWAQINGRNAIPWDEKLKLDVWYVDNRGFYLDLRIALITVFKVVSRCGVTTPSGELMPVFKGTQSRSIHYD
jgi:lipopolysaccharide/colanic/teichoic acid biosynthesis glycosyltransferase